MITILGSLIGFLTSSIPGIFKFFQDKNDKAQELAIMDKQIEMAKLNLQANLQSIEIQANTAQSQALYTTYKTNIGWVDALNGTVRPVLSYAFFILYAYVKFMQYHLLPESASPVSLWTDEDNLIFSACISYYFGSRYLAK